MLGAYLLLCMWSDADPRCVLLREERGMPECTAVAAKLANRVRCNTALNRWDLTGAADTLDGKPASLRCVQIDPSWFVAHAVAAARP